MIAFIFFFNFLILQTLFAQYYLLSTIIFVLYIILCFFQLTGINFKNKFNLHIVLIAAGLGLGTAITYTFIQNRQQTKPEQNFFHGKILRKQGKFYIIDTQVGLVKARFNKQAEQKKLFRTLDFVKFTCKPPLAQSLNNKTVFHHLDILQNVNHQCYNTKLLKHEKSFRLSWLDRLRDQLRKRLNHSKLSQAMLLADTSKLDPIVLSSYRKMGIAHLFSASGLHLSLVFFFFFIPFRLMKIEVLGKVIGILACTLFLVLLDFRVSLLRAYLFLVLYLLNKLLDRQVNGVIILCLASSIIEVIFPGSSFTVGFILSFSVTLAILLFYPHFSKLISTPFKWLNQHLALSLSAFIGSSLFGLIFFEHLNFIALIYNLLLVPIGSLYLVLAILSTALPFLSYVIDFFDLGFFYLSKFHYVLLEVNLRSFSLPYSMFISCALLMLAITCCYFIVKKKIWLIRYKFFYFFMFLSICFYAQYFSHCIWQEKRQTQVKVIPYGLIVSNQNKLHFKGVKANFIQLNLSYDLVKNSPKSIIHDASFNSAGLTHPYISIKKNADSNKGPLEFQGKCFLFLSKIDPLRWSHNYLSKCKILYFVQSKKQKVNISQWRALLTAFGYRGEILKMKYFRWHEI